MTQKNKFINAPPFIVESAAKQLGAHLRIARLRRNLTIQQVAEKIGTGTRAIADAEKGKLTTGIGIYIALLWVFDLVGQMADVANPKNDDEGQALALSRERDRARQSNKELDNDF